jgi:hypothetical protein
MIRPSMLPLTNKFPKDLAYFPEPLVNPTTCNLAFTNFFTFSSAIDRPWKYIDCGCRNIIPSADCPDALIDSASA